MDGALYMILASGSRISRNNSDGGCERRRCKETSMNFHPPEAYVAVRVSGSPSMDMRAEGVVVAVGPGALFRPPEVKVGDCVSFQRRAGFKIDIDGAPCFLVEEAALTRSTAPPDSTNV
jgi:hypothetical protein